MSITSFNTQSHTNTCIGLLLLLVARTHSRNTLAPYTLIEDSVENHYLTEALDDTY